MRGSYQNSGRRLKGAIALTQPKARRPALTWAAYLSGGLGRDEFAFCALMTFVA